MFCFVATKISCVDFDSLPRQGTLVIAPKRQPAHFVSGNLLGKHPDIIAKYLFLHQSRCLSLNCGSMGKDRCEYY